MGGERGIASGGEAGLGGDRAGRGTGDCEPAEDGTGRERQGELEGRDAGRCVEMFEEV